MSMLTDTIDSPCGKLDARRWAVIPATVPRLVCWRSRFTPIALAVIAMLLAVPARGDDVLPSPAAKPAQLSWYQWVLATNSDISYRFFLISPKSEAFLAYRLSLATKVDGRIISVSTFDRLSHEALERARTADSDNYVTFLPYVCSDKQRREQICPW